MSDSTIGLVCGDLVMFTPFEGVCPVQVEGTIFGDCFYFRARCGSWSVTVCAGPAADDAVLWSHTERYSDSNADRPPTHLECLSYLAKCADMYVKYKR